MLQQIQTALRNTETVVPIGEEDAIPIHHPFCCTQTNQLQVLVPCSWSRWVVAFGS